MTEKELKKLNRRQLLELLLQQTERADRLQANLDQTNKRLQNRILIESNAGSIAEASLKLNGVFEAAQAAADQYLENVKRSGETQNLLRKRTEAEYQKKADAIVAEVERRCRICETESRKKADAIIAEAETHCRELEAEAEKKLKEVKVLYQHLTKQKKMIDQYLKDLQ